MPNQQHQSTSRSMHAKGMPWTVGLFLPTLLLIVQHFSFQCTEKLSHTHTQRHVCNDYYFILYGLSFCVLFFSALTSGGWWASGCQTRHLAVMVPQGSYSVHFKTSYMWIWPWLGYYRCVYCVPVDSNAKENNRCLESFVCYVTQWMIAVVDCCHVKFLMLQTDGLHARSKIMCSM